MPSLPLGRSAVGWVEYNETQRYSHLIWVSRCSTQPTTLRSSVRQHLFVARPFVYVDVGHKQHALSPDSFLMSPVAILSVSSSTLAGVLKPDSLFVPDTSLGVV